MNTAAAARLAGVTLRTVQRWAAMGAVRARRILGRWVIDRPSLLRRIGLGAALRRERPPRPADPWAAPLLCALVAALLILAGVMLGGAQAALAEQHPEVAAEETGAGGRESRGEGVP